MYGILIRNAPHTQALGVNNSSLKDVTYKNSCTKPYKEATIDNLVTGGLQSNSSHNFMDSIGIGILPLINQDSTLEDSLLNILVETSINLECVSRRKNLLMSAFDYPQPNTNYTGLSIDKYRWKVKYTIHGAPSMEAS